ncbi:MAG: flagellar motor protein MotB [Hyphomonadaceae bacterium]
MIAEEHQEYAAEEENYFVTMTDLMVGLVFIFLILIMNYALQFRDVTEELTSSQTTRSAILEQLKDSLEERGVVVSIDRQSGVLRLPDDILFARGQAQLSPEGENAVRDLGDVLVEILPCYADLPQGDTGCAHAAHRIESVFVEGHTDIDPFVGAGGIDNWDLSVARATNTYRALSRGRDLLSRLCARKPDGRCDPILSVSGYGPQRPVQAGDSEEAKRRNRRIDLRIIMVTPSAPEESPGPLRGR